MYICAGTAFVEAGSCLDEGDTEVGFYTNSLVNLEILNKWQQMTEMFVCVPKIQCRNVKEQSGFLVGNSKGEGLSGYVRVTGPFPLFHNETLTTSDREEAKRLHKHPNI